MLYTPLTYGAPSRRRLAALTASLLTLFAGSVFTATDAQAKLPTASQVFPATLPTAGGMTLTITGPDLSRVTAVYLGSVKVTKLSHPSPTRITLIAPRHAAGSAKIRLVVGKKKIATRLKVSFAADLRQANDFEARVLALVNEARATARKCGSVSMSPTGPVAWSPILAGTAYAHSADMAARDYFAHTNPSGVTFASRVNKAGYRWSWLGENIAAGYWSPEAVVKGWLGSPGHCTTLMSPRATELGVGFVKAGSYGTYWTQDFGHPAG